MIFAEEINSYQCHIDALIEQNNDPYKSSPFRIYKQMSSKRKGKYFEKIVQEYLQKQGYKVGKAVNSDHDRVINDLIKLEIKGSLLWGDGTHFRWQQIRPNQDYDMICFVAVYPEAIRLYAATKDVVKSIVEVQDHNGHWIHNQHGGKTMNSGTFFIDGMPEDYSWFSSLEEVL
jgi:restriction endonuclease Mrr